MMPAIDSIQFDRVTDLIYVGSRIASMDDYHRVRAWGVRACVDMKHEGPDPWTFDAFLWLPTVDHEAPSQVHLHMGIAFLRQCERASLPVFVQCRAGVGRSSTLVLAHLLAGSMRGQPPERALEALCARHACARPNPAQIEAAVQAARTFSE